MSEFAAVPLVFHDGESAEIALIAPEHRHLGYRFVPHESGQRATNGRFRLEPQFNLSDYRCVARLDWLDISFKTSGIHGTHNLGLRFKNRLSRRFPDAGGAYVRKTDGTDGPMGETFCVRLQDATPSRVAFLCAFLKEFDLRPIVGDRLFGIPGLELAVDFFPRADGGASDAALVLARWKMSELLRKHFFVSHDLLETEDHQPRVKYAGHLPAMKLVGVTPPASHGMIDICHRGQVPLEEFAPLRLSNHFRAPLDGTVYVGKQSDTVQYRLQDKTADRRAQDEAKLALAISERRSRIEIAFQCSQALEELGIYEPADLGSGHLSKLRQHGFDFMLPTIDPADEKEHEIFERTGVFGLHQYQRARDRLDLLRWQQKPKGKRGERPRAITGRKGRCLDYKELNRKISQALSRLEKDWKREAERRSLDGRALF